jgi:Fic family protein
MMVSEAIKTSEIEREYLNRQDVMSSIKRNLGLKPELPLSKDKKTQGISELMIAVKESFLEPMNTFTLFSWHSMLMIGSKNIAVGKWQSHEEPIQIVSGGIGRKIVHYETPPSKKVAQEMEAFSGWFNNTSLKEKNSIKKPIIRTAIAHLYFESIHPFENGNGRIVRAISEKALSQHIQRPILLSLSRAVEKNKSG